MFDLQRQLDARFSELRDSRSGPVFFIEHGLTDPELCDLQASVRLFVSTHPLDDRRWNSHPLPMLVVATEVAYQYRGSGTDFWPILEAELAIGLTAAARERVRHLFESAAERYNGARPPDSPWARAFHLISWPITHALVPVEFHRPLAATLANLRRNVDDLDDESLCRAVRFAAGRASARFDTFLQDSELVAVVARTLLTVGETALAPEAVARISEDLARDNVSRRDVAIARRVQRSARNTTEAQPERNRQSSVKGRLQLRRSDGQLTLEAAFPRSIDASYDSLRRTLRRRRYAPRLWGVSARVPSEQFLSGLPFALKIASPPDEEAPLLPGLSDLEVDDQHRALLQAFELDFRPPLLFAVDADGEVSHRLRGTEISGHGRYWLVALDDVVATVRQCPNLGEVGPYTCVELDPTDPTAAQTLRDLGYSIRFGVSVRLTGAPALVRETGVPTFAVGDTRIAELLRAHPDGAVMRLGDDEVMLGDELLARLRVQEGEHLLEVSSQGESRGYPFRGVRAVSSEPSRICWLEMTPSDLTVQTLLSGDIALRVDSLAPLEGLEVTIEIETAGRRVGVSAPLGPLPQTITGDAEPWTTLLDEATRSFAVRDTAPILHARVGALASASWPLEQRVRPCWWEYDQADVALHSELGELSFGGVSANDPLRQPMPNPDVVDTEAMLLAPLDVDGVAFGPSAEFATLCVAPNWVRLEAPVQRKPRLRRRRRADHGSAGLEDVTEAYLRWALAESKTLTAEMRRRQVSVLLDSWISEICCGELWASREAELGLTSADPWRLLAETCSQTGLGRDSYVELTPADEEVVTRLAVDEIRRVHPSLWTRLGPSRDLDYEALDLACGRAYGQLAGQYEARGQKEIAAKIAEGDPGTVEEDWDSALERIKARTELHGLAELLLPTDSAAGIVALDFTLVSMPDLIEELIRWARESRSALTGGVPDAGVLEAILTLWLAPEVAVSRDWRGALDTLVADRCVARAARYMSLRSRHIQRVGTT